MTLPEPRADLGLREGYHSAQVDVEVRLNTNESPLPPPPAWLADLQAAVGAIEYHRYPDRRAWALREALADLHGLAPEQVFCANGSNEVLQSLCLAYGGAGRRALTFEPTYALHSHIAHLTGTGVVSANRRSDFTLDADLVLDVLKAEGPEITFLCSPNNPTGMSEPRGLVASVVEAAPGLVVVDEAYGQFADWSARDLLAEDAPLVVTRTFSKTWSMAAVRLGYALAPAPVVAMLERVALPYHLDAIKQAAGLLAVTHVAEMEARVGLLVRERQRLIAGLGELPVETWPSQANFVLFRPEGSSGADVWQGLVDRSVLVRDTSSWPGLEGCLRVTVGTEAENDRFLAALREVLKETGK
ncbi:histidinol-phosphate transaminase [Acidiferrimicrobium sp. IK]|uniref:histidinol-phosphate transaminase n=1 Tax=Acidiferrimicrobium sp. IK TaxID=2871700 RepID=UPI0021CB0DE3|nr:histidinol-phosphate transaminase [Acidiferrimicrobium sp. IK]MCU4183629.1 histidinol-phosphate transaminase [Acidiferrimicrobium sp. IK]